MMEVFTQPEPDLERGEDYRWEEFCQQPPGTMEGAAHQFERAGRMLDPALDLLRNASLPAWQGSAADAYRAYVTGLIQTTENYQDILRRVGVALVEAEAGILKAHVRAQRMAAEWNIARKLFAKKQATVNATSNLVEKAKLALELGAWTQATVAEMSQSAREQQRLLVMIHLDLIPKLRNLSNELADLRMPNLPTVGPATIYSPIAELQWLLGETSRAADILKLMTGPFSGFVDPVEQLLAKNPDGTYKLSAAERAWIIRHLPEDALKRLLGCSDAELEELLAACDRDTVELLANADPKGRVRPEWADAGPHDIDWQERPVPQSSSELDSDPRSLTQGGLGDCTTLATLGAVERANPGFLARHIECNPHNGTYTVTLYDNDGNPVKVTVDSSVPGGPNGGTAYAGGGDPTKPMNVYQIYEKALAAASARGIVDLNDNRAGYNDMNGVALQNVPSAVTGNPTEVQNNGTNPLSEKEIHDRINQGQAINTGISVEEPITDPTISEWVGPKGPLYNGHAYTVLGVENGMVRLRNPWGPEYTVEIPYEEWKKVCYATTTSSTR